MTWFAGQVAEWARVPVDDEGYIDTAELAGLPDAALLALAARAERTRYSGWRNHGNLWRSCLGLDTTQGKRILDFGCGLGLEAAQFVRAGNEMWLADINRSSLDVAARVCRLLGGGSTAGAVLVGDRSPFWDGTPPLDVFYANGVLHHIPWAREVLARAVRALAPGGEIRLMLYSDRGWRAHVGSEPPGPADDVRHHPDFARACRVWDRVGAYADCYSHAHLEHRFGDFLRVRDFSYIANDGRYLAATLVPLEVP